MIIAALCPCLCICHALASPTGHCGMRSCCARAGLEWPDDWPAVEVLDRGDPRQKHPAHKVLLVSIESTCMMAATTENWFPVGQLDVIKALCDVLKASIIPTEAVSHLVAELRRVKDVPHFPESMKNRAEICEIIIRRILDEAIRELEKPKRPDISPFRAAETH